MQAREMIGNVCVCTILVDGGGKRKADEISEDNSSNSDDCFDHVIGSAAVVERLWLVARYILTTTRGQ
jgi:hypothetical protein